MSKADVLTLVTTMSNSQADATAIDEYYDRVMQDLARYPWMVNASVVELPAPVLSAYTMTDEQIKLLGVFYDDRQLDHVDLLTLEAINPQWRDVKGTPFSYVMEDEAAKTYRLYPAPELPSKPLSIIYGEPTGRDYPTYAVLVLHTELRATVPVWMELPVAFKVLEREYARESDHQDMDFAALCGQVADLMFALVA